MPSRLPRRERRTRGVAAVALAVTLPSLSSRGSPDLVTHVVTSSGTQLLTLAVAVAALALAFARRDHVTYRRTA